MRKRQWTRLAMLAVGAVSTTFPAAAQTQVDLRTQTKSVDFTNAPSTRPVKTGASLPPTCTLGDLFFSTSSPGGSNIYGCRATNTWVLESSGGGGGGALTLELDSTVIGTRTVENFLTGAGLVTSIVDTGSQLNVQNSVDTAVMLTRAASQSGGSQLCASSGGTSTTYTCSMSPTLTVYTTGMTLQWKPGISGAGGATTLNIDALGAIAIKRVDGAADTASGDIIAGRLYTIWYDGAVFRLLVPPVDTTVLLTRAASQAGGTQLCASSGGTSTTYTCSLSPALTAYTTGMTLQWKPGTSGAGGATTLNIDALGAIAVKRADGTTNTAAGDIIAGRLYTIWYDGAVFRLLVPPADTTVLLTRAAAQSGGTQLCASSGGTSTTYTCSMSPALTVYTTGMTLQWKPGISGAGGATTLNIDALGAIPIKLADGVTDTTAVDIIAAQLYTIWYDGAVFRLTGPPPVIGVAGVAQPTCSVTLRGRLWFTLGATGVKDSLSACAKDAANAYAWRVLY